jgi:hypothetical protein
MPGLRAGRFLLGECIMTTTPENNAVMTIIADWDTRQAAYDRLNAELLSRNKERLFDSLSAASVTAVVVAFDGYGDEGQIRNIEVKAGEQVVAMPAENIELARAVWDKAMAECSTVSVTDAIEHFVYVLLDKTHCGWENNDGAYGDFIFDVAARTITLDYNERYTSSENFQHVF